MVEAPQVVVEGIKKVQDSQVVNMLLIPAVIAALKEMGNTDAADWIERNKQDYARGIMHGFDPQPD